MNHSAGAVEPLLRLMQRLRDPNRGCPWDLAQSFRSLARYAIEEAYEVADAAERGDMASLKDELGDLLLQVAFHAQIAAEAGLFDFADVVRAIVDKMERRHPHIFAPGTTDGSDRPAPAWEALKAAERAGAADDSALAGVTRALPALLRAEKLQRRAARVGFDWPDPAPVCHKVEEELQELAAASSEDDIEQEAGDLLFAVVNLLRHHGVEPETALRRANAKFERRFRAMEQRAGGSLAGLDLDGQEELWQAVKRSERARDRAP